MQVPGLAKIVVNMGVGEAARDSKLIDGAVRDLAAITGQKPQVTKARKSIAQFKLREGMPIGAHVTLRGDRMWEFLDRLLSLALPRIRDFRGLSPRQFDGNGNYTFGLTEQSMFHEIDQDKIDRVRGMDITVVTTATTDDEGRALLRAARLPLQGGLTMAKKALVNKANAQAEVQGARLHPLPAVRPSALGLPQVRAVPHLLPRDGAPRRAARHHQEQLVTRHVRLTPTTPQVRVGARGNHGEKGHRPTMTMTDPIADMLTASAQRQHGVPRHRRHAVTASSRRTSPRSSSRRATSPAGTSRTPRAGRQDPRPRPQVRPEPGALHRRHPPRVASPACGSTRSRPTCRGCSAAWASRSSRRRPAC